MNQKFKFGDIVKSREYIALLDKPLCFFRYSDEKSDWAECLEQDGTFHFLKVEDLELVPHPDTVRLDFIQENLIEIKLIENEDGQLFCIDKDGIWWEETFSKTVRQSIDHAMQQEQTK